jgi:hypothetical protein
MGMLLDLATDEDLHRDEAPLHISRESPLSPLMRRYHHHHHRREQGGGGEWSRCLRARHRPYCKNWVPSYHVRLADLVLIAQPGRLGVGQLASLSQAAARSKYRSR